MPTPLEIKKFKQKILSYYKKNKRVMPWRDISDPYKILVSEIMLQQTQVTRVLVKYKEFLAKFGTVQKLASAPLSDVLIVWKGLGYNRRAIFIHKTAQAIVSEYNGKFPNKTEELLKLPGIGQSTAGALMAFAFNKPVVFIETNIRSVFIHEFFSQKESEKDSPKISQKIHDSQILPLIEKTITGANGISDASHKNPRDWYYALYDYGTMLKQTLKKSAGVSGNPSQKSAHYNRQSKFEGSKRQLRAHILSYILEQKQSKTLLTISTIEKAYKTMWVKHISLQNKKITYTIKSIVEELANEGFFFLNGQYIKLTV